MIYHYQNKVTGEALVFGSLVVIPDYTTLKLGRLRYQFTELKKQKYDDGINVISKLGGVIRSKRTKT